MIRLLVFDWDGTLMDSERKIVASALAAAADLNRGDLTAVNVREIIGLGLTEAARVLFPEDGGAFHRAFIERYRDHFLERDRTPMPLFEGVAETLSRLANGGYLLAVATGKGRRGLDRVLEETGLGGLFASTRCADESRSKPDPAMLLEIMSETGVEAGQALMIGDTAYDLEMARSAGMGAVAVSYGVQACDRLLQFQPIACIDRIHDLPAVIREHAAGVKNSR